MGYMGKEYTESNNESIKGKSFPRRNKQSVVVVEASTMQPHLQFFHIILFPPGRLLLSH
jgi:hypothetical protein